MKQYNAPEFHLEPMTMEEILTDVVISSLIAGERNGDITRVGWEDFIG